LLIARCYWEEDAFEVLVFHMDIDYGVKRLFPL